MPKFREIIGDIGRGFGEQTIAQEEEKRKQEAKRKEKEEDTKFDIKKIILTEMAKRGEIGLDLDSGELIKTPTSTSVPTPAIPSNLEASSYDVYGKPKEYKALKEADIFKAIIEGTRPPEDIRKVQSEQEILDMLPFILGEHVGGGKMLAPQGTRQEGGFTFSPQGDVIGEYSPGGEMTRGGLEMLPEILKAKDIRYNFERSLSEARSKVEQGANVGEELNKLSKLYPLKTKEIEEALSSIATPETSMLEEAKTKFQAAVNSIKTEEDLELFKFHRKVFEKEGIDVEAVIKAANKKFKKPFWENVKKRFQKKD